MSLLELSCAVDIIVDGYLYFLLHIERSLWFRGEAFRVEVMGEVVFLFTPWSLRKVEGKNVVVRCFVREDVRLKRCGFITVACLGVKWFEKSNRLQLLSSCSAAV